MKSDKSKNRSDITGQTIDMEWRVCLGDTSVQILQKLQGFTLETGTHLRVFQTGSSSRACSATSPTGNGRHSLSG